MKRRLHINDFSASFLGSFAGNVLQEFKGERKQVLGLFAALQSAELKAPKRSRSPAVACLRPQIQPSIQRPPGLSEFLPKFG